MREIPDDIDRADFDEVVEYLDGEPFMPNVARTNDGSSCTRYVDFERPDDFDDLCIDGFEEVVEMGWYPRSIEARAGGAGVRDVIRVWLNPIGVETERTETVVETETPSGFTTADR